MAKNAPKAITKFKTKPGFQWTREMASKIKQTDATTFPPFDNGKVKVLMPGYHAWDNWYVMDEEGNVANVLGYTVIIALVRPVNDPEAANARIAYFYSEDGIHYEAGGFLFEEKMYADCQEWSGSTILRKDGKIQTFYTVAKGLEAYGNWQTFQRFATAIQEVALFSRKSAAELEGVEAPEVDGLVMQKPLYHSLLKEPDGELYETAAQAAYREAFMPTAHRRDVGSDQTENTCFRDPHFFKDPATGKCYLIFEGNTGPAVNAAGTVVRDYVGSESFEPNYQPTIDDLKANGCVGIIELMNDEYTYGEFHAPWLCANLVTDEIERINVVVHQGHYYLMVVGHGNKNTLVSKDKSLDNLDYLLGFRADKLGGALTPLNGSGVMISQKSGGATYGGQETNGQYVYSWSLVPSTTVKGQFDCISYANFGCDVDGVIKAIKTAGPTLTMKIDGLESHITGMKFNILPAVAK